MGEPTIIRPAGATQVVYVRRYVPAGLVLSLVLLRLAAGWHFWSEGTKKLEYNPTTGHTRVAFTAEPFLRGAVGPWADFYKRESPSFHDWERLLTVPKQWAEPTKPELDARAKWDAEHAARLKAAADKKESLPAEFPRYTRWGIWAEQVSVEWWHKVERFGALPGVTDQQREAAKAALVVRQQQLADYLGGEEQAIADWQHELWRLEEWKAEPTATRLPFAEARIEEKQAEVAGGAAGWVAQVRELEAALDGDLRNLLTAEQATNSELLDDFATAVADPAERKLERMNLIVTCVVIGVGACLLLGLFTRLAAIAGIAFLLMVMAAQPPWVAGARTEFFYYQLVEVFALLVLLVAGAGRWAGLDFFLRALFGRRRAVTERS